MLSASILKSIFELQTWIPNLHNCPLCNNKQEIRRTFLEDYGEFVLKPEKKATEFSAPADGIDKIESNSYVHTY